MTDADGDGADTAPDDGSATHEHHEAADLAASSVSGCQMKIGTWNGRQNAVCEDCAIYTLDVEWAVAHAESCKHK